MGTFISVIMPSYNGIKYIKEAVDSVLNQTFRDFELIIADDGSTDASIEYLLELNEKYDNVRVVFLERNGGIGNARNTAISMASGEYLMFIDQDDFFEAGALKQVAAELEFFNRTRRTDVLCFGVNRVDENGRLIKAFPPELSGKALRWDLCTVWTYAVRRSVITDNDIKFPTDAMNEDIIFSLQTAKCAGAIEKINSCLYNYRVNELSTSNHMSEKFNKYPAGRELVFKYAREAYDSVNDNEDRKLIFLAALAYYYSIQFGIFRRDDRDIKLREYRLHRKALEKYFGNYLSGHSVTLFAPRCRRFIYRLTVWVSYRMEKYLGQAFFEKFILLMGRL